MAECADIGYTFNVKKIMNAINDKNIEVLDKEVKQLRDENEDLQQTFREEKVELQNNFRKVKEDLIDRVVRIREEKEELEGTIYDLSDEKKNLQGVIDDLNDEKNKLQTLIQEEKDKLQGVIEDLSDQKKKLQITVRNKCVVGDDNKVLKIVRGKEDEYFISANNDPTLRGPMKGGKVIVKYIFPASMNVRKLVRDQLNSSNPAPRFKPYELEYVKGVIMGFGPKDVIDYK
jgi:uncharacterized protein YukE